MYASSTFHESENKNRTKEEGKKMEPILHMKGKNFSPNIFFRFGRFQGPREKMPLFCQHDTPQLEFPLFSVSFYSGDRESVTAKEKEKEEEEKENDDDGFQSSKNVTAAAATIQFHTHEKKRETCLGFHSFTVSEAFLFISTVYLFRAALLIPFCFSFLPLISG